MRNLILVLLAATGVAASFFFPKAPRQPEGSGAGDASSPAVLLSKRVLIFGDSIAVGDAIGNLVSIGYMPYVRQDLLQDAVVVAPRYADARPENCCGADFGLQNIARLLRVEGGKWDVIPLQPAGGKVREGRRTAVSA